MDTYERILKNTGGMAISRLTQEAPNCEEYRQDFLSSFVRCCVKISGSLSKGW
jgi:hypothetical protein